VTCSDLKYAAPKSDSNRVSPIVGLKLVYKVLDVKVDGGLGNRKLISNLFIAISISDESKYIELSSREVTFSDMLGQTGRYLTTACAAAWGRGGHTVSA